MAHLHRPSLQYARLAKQRFSKVRVIPEASIPHTGPASWSQFMSKQAIINPAAPSPRAKGFATE